MEVPETKLRELLEKFVVATQHNETRRKTAFRWFNRLYYDVRSWNDGFIHFLRTYPGFTEPANENAYRFFLSEAREYAEGLDSRFSSVKHDLCGNLKQLSARFSKDFDWLYNEDENLFYDIRRQIDNSYAVEDGIISLASGVMEFIWRIGDDAASHLNSFPQVVDSIEQYVRESRESVASLHEAASAVGIGLLSVDEYEAALSQSGSSDPQIMVMGEVTMSQDRINITNQGGVVNVKATLNNVIQNVEASSLPDHQSKALRELLSDLSSALDSLEATDPRGAKRVAKQAEALADEATAQEPDQSFLKVTAEGLKSAASTVAHIAPVVLEIATKIAAWVAALG